MKLTIWIFAWIFKFSVFSPLCCPWQVPPGAARTPIHPRSYATAGLELWITFRINLQLLPCCLVFTCFDRDLYQFERVMKISHHAILRYYDSGWLILQNVYNFSLIVELINFVSSCSARAFTGMHDISKIIRDNYFLHIITSNVKDIRKKARMMLHYIFMLL